MAIQKDTPSPPASIYDAQGVDREILDACAGRANRARQIFGSCDRVLGGQTASHLWCFDWQPIVAIVLRGASGLRPPLECEPAEPAHHIAWRGTHILGLTAPQA
jgi:hypothetical protein